MFGRTHAKPIAKRSCRSQSKKLTNHNSEIEESDLLRPIVIRCCRKGLGLSEVQNQDARAAPRDNESGKINDGKQKQFKWRHEVSQKARRWLRVVLVEEKLLLLWAAMLPVIPRLGDL